MPSAVNMVSGAATALGATLSRPCLLSGWAIRPTCMSWTTMRPPPRVHRVGDPAPARDLLGGVDAGGVEVALAHRAGLRALGDDEGRADARWP